MVPRLDAWNELVTLARQNDVVGGAGGFSMRVLDQAPAYEVEVTPGGDDGALVLGWNIPAGRLRLTLFGGAVDGSAWEASIAGRTEAVAAARAGGKVNRAAGALAALAVVVAVVAVTWGES
jgi:hypothetical protein